MDFQSAKSFGKLRLRAFQPYHLYYICQHCWYKTRISNAFNPIYVDTFDTRQGSLMHSMLSMSTLSIQFSHLIVLCIRCRVRVQTPVSTVSTNIVLNALHALIFISTVSTNKIPYSIHNSIALIFCIDHLDMPSCPFELQCRF